METTSGGPGFADGPSWNGGGLRHAILEILFDARLKRPKTGARSVKMLADTLEIEEASIEDALEDLQQKEIVEKGERLYIITARGVDFLFDQTLDYAPNVVPIIEARSIDSFSFCPECFAPYSQELQKKHQHGRTPQQEFEEFSLGILEFLLEQPIANGSRTGASAREIMVRFNKTDLAHIEFALWYLREMDYLYMGEKHFIISDKGISYLKQQRQIHPS